MTLKMKRHLDETEVCPKNMGQRKAKRGIPSKSENFNEWYPFIVEAAELVDKRYPIKGMDVWRPYGWKTMKLIDALTHAEMERTNHEEVNFPLLIPENLLEKENALVARLKRAREEVGGRGDERDGDERERQADRHEEGVGEGEVSDGPPHRAEHVLA